MSRAARSVLRKIGYDPTLDEERRQQLEREAAEKAAATDPSSSPQSTTGLDNLPDELLSESEKRHEKYRRQQAMAGRFTPAAERLPIMTAEERKARDKDRPKWNQTPFEGPIEKLIEKYKDLEEVRKHLTLGQSMKYEFTPDGKVIDKSGKVIFDGEKLV
ncbi:MAG: hypothetical protein HYW07_18275 [Candidatus Latescibacteria bacterium]|nr:hypothetical protein [Candidatus Latescibacterota bacterium]